MSLSNIPQHILFEGFFDRFLTHQGNNKPNPKHVVKQERGPNGPIKLVYINPPVTKEDEQYTQMILRQYARYYKHFLNSPDVKAMTANIMKVEGINDFAKKFKLKAIVNFGKRYVNIEWWNDYDEEHIYSLGVENGKPTHTSMNG